MWAAGQAEGPTDRDQRQVGVGDRRDQRIGEPGHGHEAEQVRPALHAAVVETSGEVAALERARGMGEMLFVGPDEGHGLGFVVDAVALEDGGARDGRRVGDVHQRSPLGQRQDGGLLVPEQPAQARHVLGRGGHENIAGHVASRGRGRCGRERNTSGSPWGRRFWIVDCAYSEVSTKEHDADRNQPHPAG